MALFLLLAFLAYEQVKGFYRLPSLVSVAEMEPLGVSLLLRMSSETPNVCTPEEKNIREAEVALTHATLVLLLVLNSQSETFSLGLDTETITCWDEVKTVWKDRSHGPSASKDAQASPRLRCC